LAASSWVVALWPLSGSTFESLAFDSAVFAAISWLVGSALFWALVPSPTSVPDAEAQP